MAVKEGYTFVCTGVPNGDDRTSYVKLQMVTGVGLGEPKHFKRSRFRRLRVGHVYTIYGSEDGNSLDAKSSQWLEEYKDAEQVAAWQAQYQCDEVERNRINLEKREATNTSGLEHSLGKLQAAYRKLRPADRPAFELWLLNQLRR